MMMSFGLVSFASNKDTRAYLPLEVSGKHFNFSTMDIPEGLSVTVTCFLSKVNGQKPRDDSYIFVYPHAGSFSSIVENYNYNKAIEIGSKVYKWQSNYYYYFDFRINGVTRENQAVIIDTRREGKHALKGFCYY